MTPPKDKEHERCIVDRSLVVWRWIFLCALTSLATLLFMWMRGGLFLDVIYHPYRGGFVGVVYAVTMVFLLYASPFFFRRLGGLAILAWLTAIFAAIWLVLPVF